eukprot:403333287
MQEKNNAQSQSFQTAIENAESHSQYLLDSRNNKSQISILKQMVSSKRISLAMLSINMSNVITAPVYGAFMIAEALFPIYSLAIIIQSQIYDINIEDTWIVENYMDSEPIKDYLFINIAILLIYLVMIIMLGITCYHKESFTQVKDNSFIQTTLSIMTSALLTFLVGVYLHIILRVFLIKTPEDDLGLYVALQLINAINFAILLWTQIFLKRVITLKLPSPRQPFAKIDHRNDYLLFFLEIGIIGVEVIFANFHQMFQYVDVISIILLIITLGVCLSKLFVVPIYNKLINTIQNFMLWITLSCCFIIVINAFDKSVSAVNVYYLAILLPFMLGMSFLIQYHWEYRIMDKIRVNQSKMEVQHQYILYLLTEHVRNLRGDKEHQNQSLKYLFGILDDHNGECLKNSCLCHQSESIVWILNQKNDENQQIIELSGQDIDFLNSIQNDRLYTKEHYSTAPFTFNDYQDKKYIMLRKKQVRFNKDNEEKNYTMEFVFEDDKTEEALQNDYFILKIDPTRLKQAFFANFVRQYYEQAILKFPESYQIKIMYANFALFQMRNMFLSINILKSIDDSRVSLMDKLCIKMSKYHLLTEIEKIQENLETFEKGFDTQDIGAMRDNSKINERQLQQFKHFLNPEKYIEYDNLIEGFKYANIQLTQDTLKFWHLVVDQELKLNFLIKQSQNLAITIDTLYKIFKQIEQFDHNHNEDIYYQFALIHREILNDKTSAEFYLQKYKQALNIRKFMKSNYNINKENNIGILQVSGQFNNFGKILECNKQLKEMSGFKNEDLKYANYEIFMSHLIKGWHGSFVQHFNQSGRSTRINKKSMNMFMMTKSGYVKPVQLLIKTLYSDTHGQSMIGFFNPIKEMHLDSQIINQPIDQLIFLLCDNINGKIYDVCQNAKKQLKIKRKYLLKNQQFFDKNLQISDILSELDIPTLNQQNYSTGNKDQYSKHQFQDGFTSQVQNCEIQTSKFEDNQNLLRRSKKAKKNQISSNQQQFQKQFQGESAIDILLMNQILNPFDCVKKSQLHNVQYFIFQEQYIGNFQMNIVVLNIKNEQNQNSQMQFQLTDGLQDKNQLKSNVHQQQVENQFGFEDDIYMDMNSDSASAASSQTGSQESSKLHNILRSQQMSSINTMPRTLKIVFQLSVLMFVTMIIVSSVNLYLVKSKQDDTVRQIRIVRESYNKIYYATRSRMTLRLLIDMANGNESLNSTIIPNKYQFLMDQLTISQNSLLDSQQYLENVQFQYSDKFKAIFSASIIKVEYLDDQGRVQYSNHTMSYLINSYVAQLLQIQNMSPQRLKGRTMFQTTKVTQPPYKPTDDEKVIFWAAQNGNNAMRSNNFIHAQMYTDDIIEIAQQNIQFQRIALIISIVTIVAVFTFVTPIISLIMDRQYTMINFFISLDKALVTKFITQSSQFLQYFVESQELKELQAQNTFQEYSQTVNGQNARRDRYKMSQKVNQDNSISSNQSLVSSSYMTLRDANDNSISEFDTSKISKYEIDSQNFTYNSKFNSSSFQTNKPKNTNQIKQNSSSQNIQNALYSGRNDNKKLPVNINDIELQVIQNSSIKQQNIDIDSLYSGNQINQRSLNGQNGKSVNIKGGLQDLKDLQVENQKNNEIEETQKNEKQVKLKQVKIQRRWKVAILNIMTMCFFSIYFIAAYFVTENLYSNISYIMQSLNVIYFRDICSENVMIYLRTNFISNSTVMFLENGKVASTEFISRCYQYEDYIQQMKKSKHEAFASGLKDLEVYDTNRVCNSTLASYGKERVNNCYTNYKGLMQKGLANAISIIIPYLNKLDLSFTSQKNRTQKYLEDLIKNEDLREMIEMKLYNLDPILQQMKDKMTESVNSYLQTQTNIYAVLFTIFITVLFIMILIVYGVILNRMKLFMLKINITLKILPLDDLSQDDIIDLKSFIKY